MFARLRGVFNGSIFYFLILIFQISLIFTCISCASQKPQLNKALIKGLAPNLANVLYFKNLPSSCLQADQIKDQAKDQVKDQAKSIDPRFALMAFRDAQNLRKYNPNLKSDMLDQLLNYQILFVLDVDTLKNQADLLKTLTLQNHFFALDLPMSKKILEVIDVYEKLLENDHQTQRQAFEANWQKSFHQSFHQLAKQIQSAYPSIRLIAHWHSDLDRMATENLSPKKQEIAKKLLELLLEVKPFLFQTGSTSQNASDFRWIEGSSEICQSDQAFDHLIDQIEQKQIISTEKSLFADHFNPFLSLNGLKVMQMPKSFEWTNDEIKQIQQCRTQIGIQANAESNTDQSIMNWAWVIRDFKDELLIFPFFHTEGQVPSLYEQQSEAYRIYLAQAQINSMIFCHFKINQSQIQPINHLDLNWYSLKVHQDQALNPQDRWYPKILPKPLAQKHFKPLEILDFLELESTSPLSWEFKGILSELLTEIKQVENQQKHWPYFQVSSMEMPIYQTDGALIAVGWMLLFQYIPYLFLSLESGDQNFELLSENLVHLRSPYLLLIPPQAKIPTHLWHFEGNTDLSKLRKNILPFSTSAFQKYFRLNSLDLKERSIDFLKKGGTFSKQTLLTMMPKNIWQMGSPVSFLADSDSLLYADLRSQLKQKLGILYRSKFFSELFSLKFQEKLSIDMGVFGLIELQTLSPSDLAE